MSRLKFSKSIVEVIESRYSCRKFKIQQLDNKTRNTIRKLLQGDHTSPIEGETRFELIQMSELNPREKRQLGTYGFIQGAQNFIVGATKKSEFDLENFGYIMEELILSATEFGLGTCWVGGTLKRSKFADQIDIKENEAVPAVTPIGYAAKDRSKVDRLMHWVVKSRRRHPWEIIFFEGDCEHPLTHKKADHYEIPLEMVRLAPSASNRQPWRIIKEKDTHNYHFFIMRKRSWYSRFLSWPDFPRLDLGIAICHFNLTAKELELKGDWHFLQPEIIIPPSLEYFISWISE